MEFATRRVRNNVTGFFHRFYWTTNRFDFTLIAALLLAVVYDIPHLILLGIQGLPEKSATPTDCYGDHIWMNAGLSVFFIIVVIHLRQYQLREHDPYGIGLETDIFNYAGIPFFPFFHGVFFYEYYYKKALFSDYFTPFYSNMMFIFLFHISTIWVPIFQSKCREQVNMNRIRTTMDSITLDTILTEDFVKNDFKRFIREKNIRDADIVELYLELHEFKSSLFDGSERRDFVHRMEQTYFNQGDNGLVILSAPILETIRARIAANDIQDNIFDEAFE